MSCANDYGTDKLSNSEVEDIIAALRVAAETYRNDAAATQRLIDAGTVGESHARVVAQFRQQAADAESLAERLEA